MEKKMNKIPYGEAKFIYVDQARRVLLENGFRYIAPRVYYSALRKEWAVIFGPSNAAFKRYAICFAPWLAERYPHVT